MVFMFSIIRRHCSTKFSREEVDIIIICLEQLADECSFLCGQIGLQYKTLCANFDLEASLPGS